MEQLSKQQIVLLMILVSFVTSIATGITVVSLLDQAPQGVTQTINQVVERTIEKVVPTVVYKPSEPKEVTVVVREEDFVTQTIEQAKKSVVRIKDKKTGALLGMGVAVSADGKIAVNADIVTTKKTPLLAVFNNSSYDLSYFGTDSTTGITFLSFATTTPTEAVTKADSKNIKEGQSAVALSGTDRDTVSIGIISSIDPGNYIQTTISQNGLLSGTPIFNLQKELIAIKIGKDKDGNDILTTVNKIDEALGRIMTANQ